MEQFARRHAGKAVLDRLSEMGDRNASVLLSEGHCLVVKFQAATPFSVTLL